MTTTTDRPANDSDLARAYRAARRYSRHAPNPGRHPAHLALTYARQRLAKVAELRAEYEAAEAAREAADARAASNPSGGNYAAGLQALSQEAQRKRSAMVEAMARAGQFHHGPQAWRVWPAASWSQDRATLYLTQEDGVGAVRGLKAAEDVCSDLPRGYYDNPHGESFKDGSGLILPVVAALSRGRFLAGWRNGGCDGGPALSSHIFGGPDCDPETAERDAARYADGMAERVADDERDYKEAWNAANDWAEAGGRLIELRSEIRGWIAELRTACGVSRDAVCEGLKRRLAERAELIETRATLAQDYDHLDGWADGVAG